MALHGTSGTLGIFLLVVTLTAQPLLAQFTDVAQTEGEQTRQHNEDNIEVDQRTSSENCEDSSSKCAKWATKGKCSKGKVFEKCRSSCPCGVNSNPTCEDTKNKCSKWAAKGKCSEKKVYKKCRNSCRCASKCPEGFFKVGAQCFKFYPKLAVNWETAKSTCEAEGLELAKPDDPISLKNYIVETYEYEMSEYFVWVGARGTGTPHPTQGWIEWIRDGTTLFGWNSAWSSGMPGPFTSTNYCVGMSVTRYNMENYPTTTYTMGGCEYIGLPPLCELVM